jgi:hypothetical protein
MKTQIKITDDKITYIVSTSNKKKDDYDYYNIDNMIVSKDENCMSTYVNKDSIGTLYAIAQRVPETLDRLNTLILSTDKRDIEDGWTGNSDHTIRRHSGWRGTTNNVAIYAEGTGRLVSYSQHKNTHRTKLIFERILV